MAYKKTQHPLKLPGSAEWDQAKVAEYIIPFLRAGKPLAVVLDEGFVQEGPPCLKRGLPYPATIRQWDNWPEIKAAMDEGREREAARLVAENLADVSAPPERKLNGEVDGGAVRHLELKVKTKQWKAERLDPEAWGQKAQLDVNMNLPDIAGVLAAARARAMPVIEGHAERVSATGRMGTGGVAGVIQLADSSVKGLAGVARTLPQGEVEMVYPVAADDVPDEAGDLFR